MPTISNSILIRGFGSIATIEPVDGTSEAVAQGGKFLLRGPFKFKLLGALSNAVSFGLSDSIVVAQVSGQWNAVSSRQRSFSFAAAISVQPDPYGPWLKADLISFWLGPDTQNVPLISLTTASISLIGHAPYNVSQRLICPRENGGRQDVVLSPLPHPDAPNRNGLFLRPYSEGFAVFCSTFSDVAFVDPRSVANFQVPPSNELVFHVSSTANLAPPTPLRINRRTGATAPLVTVHPITLAALPNAHDQVTYAFADNLEAAEGWLSVARFTGPEISVERIHSNTGLVAPPPSTRIFSGVDRLTFHLPLPRADGSEAGENPQFLYQHPDVESGGAIHPGPRDRHYGLRVRGLGSTRTASPVLDANLLRVILRKPNTPAPAGNGNNLQNFGTFEFEGGHTTPYQLPRQSTPKRSIIVPKIDPGDPARGRSIEIPSGLMSLQCVNSAAASPSLGTILFDSGANLLEIRSPQLLAPPTGTSGTGDSPAAFDRWTLTRRPSNPTLGFDAQDGGVFPKDRDKWLDHANGWDSVSREFKLPEYPGTAMHIDGPASSDHLLLTGLTAPSKTSVSTTTAFGGSTKEKVIYTAFCAYLGYKLIKPADDPKKKSLPEDKIAVVFKDLPSDAQKKWVKDNGLESLVVAFSSDSNTEDGILSFIDDNMPTPRPDEFVWPFAMGLAIYLWKKDGSVYAPDLARARNANAKPGLAFDFSTAEKVDPRYLGWTDLDWQTFKEKSPALWPVLADSKSGKLDPSDEFWRGIMFRDLALTFPLPANVQGYLDKCPLLKNLYDGIEQHLLLDYGWKDETGSTWSGGFELDRAHEVSLTPQSWDEVFRIKLVSFTTQGTAGRVVGSEGKLRIELPFIRTQNPPPFGVIGGFAINITDGVALDRIEIVPTNPQAFSTTGIPGFERVTFLRFATDLRSGRVDLKLEANANLRNALPFLADPISASVTINFSGDLPGGAVSMALTIPTEIHTNIFGKWQASVQGLQIKIRTGGKNELRIRCRLNLGLPGFVSVEGDVVITQDPEKNDWDVRLQLQKIGGEISIGDWKIGGELSWSEPDGTSSPVDAGKTAAAANSRDLWGEVDVTTGSFFKKGQYKMFLRIGNQGALTYWVGGIQIPEIPFGVGKLKQPFLVLAHHADTANQDLRKAVMAADPGGLGNLIRPDNTSPREWLKYWKPTDQVGLLIAASGYLHLHDQVASAPEEDKKYLTSLLLTDSGLIRVDAYAKLLKTLTVQFALAVDLQREQFVASIHAPTFKYPTEEDPEFVISGGVLTLGFGYGDHFYFLTKVGWPELLPGSDVERNWDDSVKVVWDNMIPINTFWGGFRAELDSSSHISLGFALRAGWTKSYSVGGGVAGGKAELGVAVGGVVEFRFAWASTDNNLIQLSVPRDALFDRTMAASRTLARSLAVSQSTPADLAAMEDALIANAIDLVEAHIAAMNLAKVSAGATIYADVWGSASVYFLGVTIASISVHGYARLQVCIDAPKITRVYANVGFDVSVKIGCVTFGAHASIDIVLKDGPCPTLGAFYAQLIDEPPLN